MMAGDCKTWVEIDVDALRSNLRCVRETIGPQRAILLVVKSDGYGHGAETATHVAAAEGVRHFAVATTAEAAALRDTDVRQEILLLHPPLDFEVRDAIRLRLTPTISDESTALRLEREAAPNRLPIHVEINTGLNRLGVHWDEAVESVTRIAALRHLRISGIFTHFRAANGEGAESVETQMARFARVLTGLSARGIDVGLRHVASSAALLHHLETCLDGVRPGMIVYGGVATPSTGPLSRIRPVMAVRARVLHVLDVAAGDWIHYGEGFRAARSMRVAVLPIGYGMGYLRHLSNVADVLIAGRRCPVVGVIGMDMTMVDLSAVPQTQIGDVATIMGRDGDDEITAVELAERAGTIPYEITCALGNRLPRCEVNSASTSPAPACAKEPVAT